MRAFICIILFLALIWLGGFAWYISKLAHVQIGNIEKTDAIVVLTGGQNRLGEAIKLLEEGLGAKLYISGVDEKVTRPELINLLGSSQELAQCCIESGSEATDTVGNAVETMQWAAKNNIKSLRVVTSLEHMPRAMVEFRHYMPDTNFIEHSVGAWRPENINYFNLAQEYSKYIISLLRSRASEQIYDETS